MDARLIPTDHELMAAVARGELAQMSEIYERRHRSLFRFFFRLTGKEAAAEDLSHEVFLRMIRYRHTYRSGDGFEAWMYRIARNAFADQMKKYRLETPGADEMDVADETARNPLHSAVQRQELALLNRAMSELADEKRELIVLSRFQGLSYERIGQIVGCETGTVKVRVFRAIKEMNRIFLQLQEGRAL